MNQVKMNEISGFCESYLIARQFKFDHAYDQSSRNQILYKESIQPQIEAVIMGYNTLIMAYGQTGSGKTYTIQGTEEDRGCIPSAISTIFQFIQKQASSTKFVVTASYYQICNESIMDLLKAGNDNLRVRESIELGIYIENLTEVECTSENELLKVVSDGQQNRSIFCTNMGTYSSRQHALFQVKVRRVFAENGEEKATVGTLLIADLAGSELAKAKVNGSTLEGIRIGKSLNSLNQVVKALVDGNHHVPFRDSRLTRLLTDYLRGNAYISLIVSANPCLDYYENTADSVQFASRFGKIRIDPKANFCNINQMSECKCVICKDMKNVGEVEELKVKQEANNGQEAEKFSISQDEQDDNEDKNTSGQPDWIMDFLSRNRRIAEINEQFAYKQSNFNDTIRAIRQKFGNKQEQVINDFINE